MTGLDRFSWLRRRRWILVALGGALVVGALYGAHQAYRHWSTKPSYTTRTISLWPYSGARKDTGIWWIDNDRVIFSGGDESIVVPSAYQDRPLALQAIFTWDTRTTTYRREVELDVLGTMTCYEDGRFRYYTSTAYDKVTKERQIQRYEAVLGQEPVPVPARNLSDGTNRGMWLDSRVGCFEDWETSIVRPHQAPGRRIIWPLMRSDGYLYAPTETGAPNYRALMNSPVEWWRPMSDVPLRLPMMIKELRGTSMRFSVFRQVYIIPAGVRADESRPDQAGYTPGIPRPVYFIYRDGRVEVKSFPGVDWSALGEGFLPMTAGHLVVSNFTRRAHSKDMGAWIFRDGIWHKLVDHIVEDFSVSPDGCKAVVAIHNPDVRERLGRSITAFDFCSGGSVGAELRGTRPVSSRKGEA